MGNYSAIPSKNKCYYKCDSSTQAQTSQDRLYSCSGCKSSLNQVPEKCISYQDFERLANDTICKINLFCKLSKEVCQLRKLNNFITKEISDEDEPGSPVLEQGKGNNFQYKSLTANDFHTTPKSNKILDLSFGDLPPNKLFKKDGAKIGKDMIFNTQTCNQNVGVSGNQYENRRMFINEMKESVIQDNPRQEFELDESFRNESCWEYIDLNSEIHDMLPNFKWYSKARREKENMNEDSSPFTKLRNSCYINDEHDIHIMEKVQSIMHNIIDPDENILTDSDAQYSLPEYYCDEDFSDTRENKEYLFNKSSLNVFPSFSESSNKKRDSEKSIAIVHYSNQDGAEGDLGKDNSFIEVLDEFNLDIKLQEAGNKLVIIDFYTTWCGPCKMIAPFLEDLAKKNPDTLVIVKVDVDDNEELSAEYEVSCMPTFIFMKNKEKVGEFAGANQEKLLELYNKLK